MEAGPTPEEPEPPSFLDSADSAQELRHRSTGLPLNPEMVKKARELEMQYMDELHVLEHSDRDTCMAKTGRPPIRTDWVDIDKGESSRPNYRSRVALAGQQLILEDWAATFAETLPYEDDSPRSEVQGDDEVLMLDISRANLDSPLARVVFVTINGKVHKLIKAMYGLRDAGASFDREVFDVMNLMGVSLGNFSIYVGYRKAEW